jgi:hypothetical protein
MYILLRLVTRGVMRELRIGKLFSPADAGIRVRFPSSRGPGEVNTTEVISRRRRRKESGGQMNKRRQHAGYLAACVGGVDRMRKAGQRPYRKYASQEAGCCNLLATRGAGIKYLYVYTVLQVQAKASSKANPDI